MEKVDSMTDMFWQSVDELEKNKKQAQKVFEELEEKKREECGVGVMIQPMDSSNGIVQFKFQVADVQKPLMSVQIISDQGNKVFFGPMAGDNYILNPKTGHKIMMISNGRGSYQVEVRFVGGGTGLITVDSGAEESVCPRNWGEQFPMMPVTQTMNFKGASGNKIAHYGQRMVECVAPF